MSVHTARRKRAVAIGEAVRLQWNTYRTQTPELLVFTQGFSVASKLLIINSSCLGKMDSGATEVGTKEYPLRLQVIDVKQFGRGERI